MWFQHTAARRRLARAEWLPHISQRFQHTAARRRLVGESKELVPTRGFNTQPPEGGWFADLSRRSQNGSFNTQPPEGGWY